VRRHCSARSGLFGEAEKNQLSLYEEVVTLFAEPGEPDLVVAEKGHGRLERREVRSSGDLAEYSDFPGLKQVVQIKKRVVELKPGTVSESIQYGIASLRRAKLSQQGCWS
jgi:hypothetical protein